MPSKPRYLIYEEEDKHTIHAWTRCARDLYALGKDGRVREDHSHRTSWVNETLAILAANFAIEIQANAVMENHEHLVLTNRPEIPRSWSPREVVTRWLTITKLKISGGSKAIRPTEKRIAKELKKGQRRIKTLRKRLASFSWFMGTLNENISRRINREERRAGTNWQRRFECRVAEGDEEVQTMMEYVDLNPIRAGIVDRIEDSIRSSVGCRIMALLAELHGNPFPPGDYRAALWLGRIERQEDPKRSVDDPIYMKSATGRRASDSGVLPFSERSYLVRLDAQARVKRPDKRGFTPSALPPVLERIGIAPPG